MTQPQQHPSSYRDPSGYIFTYQNEIYRQVNQSFQKDFEAFIQSGLYKALVDEKLLLAHEVVDRNLTGDADWWRTLKPQQLAFVSYPYEWSFSMLKDAALLTLQLAVRALEYGMMLKDASPYNVQLHQGRMTFIDTLSFERYTEGEPWIAYRQFCENFVAPLALMHYQKLPMQQLLLAHPDGIPLVYAKKLLPYKSRFNIHLYMHIHLHASYGAKQAGSPQKKPALSKQKLVNLLRSLQALVQSFQFDGYENVWGNYYEEAGTRPGYLEEKNAVISAMIKQLPPLQSVLDIGGNKGEFSKHLAADGKRVICADGEHYAVESLYKEIRNSNQNVIPLCIDFTKPTPAIGVNNTERDAFFIRASSDLVMALALIHHLSIGKNISFALVADMCARLGKYLPIEFVAKEDEKVKLLLQNKKDIYQWYTEDSFLQAFATRFRTIEKRALSSSPRTLYLMERL